MRGRGQDRSAIGGPLLPTSSRLLQVLSLLQSRRFWTGSALAEATGVTERSVRRDVDRLRELGYPVHATAGVGGGYALGAGQDLPPLPLDDDEALAVAVGLRAVASGWVTGLEGASVRALTKLEQVLPRRLRRRLGDLQAVTVAMPHGGARIDALVLTSLSNACRDEVVIRFEYGDRAGVRSGREVEPYRLVHSHTRWYLLAFDLVRADWRTFRVDRIRGEAEPRGRFRPRPLPDDDVGAYVARNIAPEAWRTPARIVVHAPAEVLTQRVPAAYGQVEAIDAERSLLTVTGEDPGWLAAWLGMLCFELEVLEPPELVERIRELAGRYGRAVDRSSGAAHPGAPPPHHP